MQILAAPIQEYTDVAFRNAHAKTIGGIVEYYIPFVRLERNELPKRAMLEVEPKNNIIEKTVPQILVKSAEETHILLEKLSSYGYSRVDFNFGCPFPKVVKSSYGAGMLLTPDKVRIVLDETKHFANIRFSVKMRLGVNNSNDWQKILPVLNDFPLEKIVLHPRTAQQQYTGTPERKLFECFISSTQHSVFFNGDINSQEDATDLDKVMIGRGLLANPLLSLQLLGTPIHDNSLASFHNAYVEECSRIYQQPLLKLKLFWDYFLPNTDKRIRKQIQKCTTIDEYLSLTQTIFAK